MKNFSKKILTFLFLFLFLFNISQTKAETTKVNIKGQLEAAGQTNGPFLSTNQYTLASSIGGFINAFFSLLGMIFIILMVYGGYNYMTARGEEDKINKALSTIRQAIIGLIITIGSIEIYKYYFVNFIGV